MESIAAKKGSTTVFMGKQTGDDCKITLVLQLLSEKWKLVNCKEHLSKKVPFSSKYK